jgi:hypothetical protein
MRSEPGVPGGGRAVWVPHSGVGPPPGRPDDIPSHRVAGRPTPLVRLERCWLPTSAHVRVINRSPELARTSRLTPEQEALRSAPGARRLAADARRGALVVHPTYPLPRTSLTGPISAIGFVFRPPANGLLRARHLRSARREARCADSDVNGPASWRPVQPKPSTTRSSGLCEAMTATWKPATSRSSILTCEGVRGRMSYRPSLPPVERPQPRAGSLSWRPHRTEPAARREIGAQHRPTSGSAIPCPQARVPTLTDPEAAAWGS